MDKKRQKDTTESSPPAQEDEKGKPPNDRGDSDVKVVDESINDSP